MWRWLTFVMLAGCAGDVTAKVTVKRPPPAPTPIETAEPRAETPKKEVRVPLRASDMSIESELAFYDDGSLAPPSTNVIDELAKALTKNREIDLVAVAAHVTATNSAESDAARSNARAAALVDALVTRGIDRKRLRAQGQRCESDRMDIVVLRRSGKDTSAALGCP